MKRREFIKTSLVASAAAATTSAATAADQSPTSNQEFYELRQYHLRQGPMLKRFDDFYRDVALPAWNRAGVTTVGVFDVMIGPDQPTKYVLLPFKSWEAVAAAREKFEADETVSKSEFSTLPPTDPGYIRKENTLLLAFTGIPKLEIPPQVAEKKSRIFELRTYEAHSRKANRKKVEMFNVGEIEIFRRCGLRPVFFGEGLVGRNLPQLTYMLVFDDMAARDKNWGTFVSDPAWKKLSTTPGYTNPEILTNITSVFLRPTGYSQV
ncbi:MAG: NIPSNAP family containing protein [Verrucomicrobia bacterium]|nr:NIPSNAP family containing protein [Verrucomicrobiota bacterium]